MYLYFHSPQFPKGVFFSLDWSLPAQIVAIIKKAFPAQEGIFCRFKLSPKMKLSRTIKTAPVRPSKKGLYVHCLFSL